MQYPAQKQPFSEKSNGFSQRGKARRCACFFYPNTVMAVVQESNLIPFSSTRLTITFQTVAFTFIIFKYYTKNFNLLQEKKPTCFIKIRKILFTIL